MTAYARTIATANRRAVAGRRRGSDGASTSAVGAVVVAGVAVAGPPVVAGLRLVRLVGAGGEGEVWEALDAHRRRRALKLIRPGALASVHEVGAREAYLRRIEHPSLVRVYRSAVLAGERAGWGLVEMAFVEGPCLDAAAPDPLACRRLAPVAEALDLLHAGVWSDGVPLVHRDVKPANLIATPDGIVLVDLSTLRDAGSGEQTALGTPVFAAPELLHQRGGPPADVYAFAVTLVALTTGTRGATLRALVEQPARLDVPPAVRAALSPDPATRPQSCRALVDEAPAVVPAPGSARALGPRPVSLRPWPWVVLLFVLIAAPLYAWVIGFAPGVVARLGALAFAAHLAVHARRRLAVALFVPPLAWAILLSDRLPVRPRRRAWSRSVVFGALLALAGAVLGPVRGDASGVVAATALAGVAVCLGVRAPLFSGVRGLLARVALLPLWAVGTGALAAAAIVLGPLAAIAGGAPPLRALAREGVASVVEVAVAARHDRGADWRRPGGGDDEEQW